MDSGTATPDLTTQGAIEGFPLSLQQARLWSARGGGDTPFRVHAALLLEGAVDEVRLRRALATTVARNEALRTRFARIAGMEAPLQVIEDAPAVEWEEVDLGAHEPPLQQLLLQRLFADQASVPFRWDDAAPLRLHLVRLAEERRVLLVGLPALSFDAFSVAPLMDELAAAYADDDAPEPVQYVDFTQWQNEMLESPEEEGGREFWRGVAAEAPVPPALERRGARGGDPFAPQAVSWVMPAERVAVAGATPEAVLLAAWAALFNRLTGAPSVTLGRLSHGRMVEDLKATMGPLFKSLPVRVAPGAAHSFEELARQAQAQIEAADAHHEFFAPRADEAPYLFELREWPAAVQAGGVRVSLLMEHACHEPFRLKLSATARGGELHCSLWFDPARYSAGGAELMAAQLRALLDSVLADPRAPLAAAELVDEGQRRLLAGWNETAREYPRETFVSRFEARVERDPGADAVVFRDTVLSFGELNARANQVARHLRELGIGPEDRVAFCLNRSAELVVMAVGILKAGAAYVPLDPWQPAERLRLIVEEVEPALVVADREFFENVRLDECPLVERGELEARAAAHPRDNPPAAARPENLAYLIYTSGSTGRPKGVMIQHASLCNLQRALADTLGADLPPRSRVSINAPLAFDSSVKQLVQLLDGHAVCVLPEEVRRDGAELLAYLRDHRIEVLDCTPAQLQLMMAAGLEHAEETLRLVLLGGEAVDEKSWRQAAQRTRTAFYNVYGPTECTVDATARRVTGEVDRPLIGGPLPNVRVYLLDEALRPVAVGAAGQLCIGGRGVGRGYFRRPGLTAGRFVPDPFGEPGARMYLTGDQARFLADGELEFLGRIDRQVKLRGYRIELGEIEEVLLTHPGVRQSAVVLHEDAGGQARLVAYAAPERRWSPTIEGHPRFTLPNGLSVVHHHEGESQRLYAQCFDRGAWAEGLPEAPVVVDAGANVGLFALAMRAHRPGARVLAFEPAPPLHDLLRINAELYGDGVEAVAAGLGREEGSGRFVFHPAWSLLSGPAGTGEELVEEWAPRWRGGGGAPPESLEYEAPSRTLSAVLRERAVERVDLLRVAVHRGELEVLAGVDAADWARIGRVAVEICEREGEPARRRLEAVRGVLEPLGFTLRVSAEPPLAGADVFVVHATRGGAADPGPGPRAEPAEEALATGAALRRFVKERLPEYMVPAQFVVLERLPLTPNGKVDRRALPRPGEERPELASEYERPEEGVQQQLAEIWSRLLGVERIGIRDNFFELGGDSILSIQVVARAADAGIRLTPRQMFEFQTIAELAAVAGESHTVEAEQGMVSGEIPLTPVQHRMLERGLADPSHWNQAVMLAGHGELDAARMESVLGALVEHHDVLRHRFHPDPWRQESLPTARGSLHFTRADLSSLPEEERGARIAELAEEAQRGLDLENGPLVRAAAMTWSGEWRLLLVIHHLVVDGVSWRILLEDLQKGFRQLSAGEEVQLGRKTTSFRYWSERLGRWAAEVEEELPYWLDEARGDVLALPRDGAGENLEASAEWAEASLDEERTRQLLQDAPRAYSTTVQEVLLAALATALARWSGAEGGQVLVELEGHGREALFDEVELSRTVGWFTALYPVLLPAGHEPGESLARTKEALRRVPGRGVGYGVLRYLGSDEVKARLAAFPDPEVGFNYLGRLDEVLEEDGAFRVAPESAGPSRSPRGARAHLLDVSASVSRGRLELRFIYSRELHRAESIARLVELTRARLVELIQHCLDPEAGAYTPSDFPMASLDDEQLGAILEGFEFQAETEA